ncbi:MAG: hypothetical protein WDN00_05285 [Limisphaerales bacterium]
MQKRVVIAQERLAFDTGFMANDDTKLFCAGERWKLLLKNQQFGSFGRVKKFKVRFRWDEYIATGCQRYFLAANFRAAFAGEQIVKMFQETGVARPRAVCIERDLNLREARAVHHRRNVHDRHAIFPARQVARHKTIRREQGITRFDDRAGESKQFIHKTGFTRLNHRLAIILPPRHSNSWRVIAESHS